MTTINNDYKDRVFIQFVRDTVVLPHPNGKDFLEFGIGQQLCWSRKFLQKNCKSCSGSLVEVSYEATGCVDGPAFDFGTLLVPAQYVVETTQKTFIQGTYDAERRGIHVQAELPPHLRDGYIW